MIDSTDVFDVAPDFESYEYTPLDIKADRKFIEGCWSWNNSFDGKAFADAKVRFHSSCAVLCEKVTDVVRWG